MSVSGDLAGRLGEAFGLARGVVRMAPPDPCWPVVFHLFADELLPVLPGSVVAIEHVGSTAVPGLAAKPILDIAVGVPAAANPEEVSQALERFGFLRRGDAEDAELDRNFGFELENRVRLVNAHLVRFAGPEWNRYVTFRDRLRADVRARDEYARLKAGLANQFSHDRGSYVEGKTTFVRTAIEGG